MSHAFVHGKHALTQELVDALGLKGKPIRSLSIRMCVSEEVSVVAEFVPQEAEVQALLEHLKAYQLHEAELPPSILDLERPLDPMGHQWRTRPVRLEGGIHDGETARLIVGGKVDRERRSVTKEGEVYVATDRRHGGDFGLQVWCCRGVEPPAGFFGDVEPPVQRKLIHLEGGPADKRIVGMTVGGWLDTAGLTGCESATHVKTHRKDAEGREIWEYVPPGPSRYRSIRYKGGQNDGLMGSVAVGSAEDELGMKALVPGEGVKYRRTGERTEHEEEIWEYVGRIGGDSTGNPVTFREWT
jgi:hypothetical protein